MKTKHHDLTVLHVATLNQPIRPDLPYGPIETVIYNIDKGLHSSGHRSIVACSGDSSVVGEHYVTVDRSIGHYWTDDTLKRRSTMNTHLSRSLQRARLGDVDVIHTHDLKAVEHFYNDILTLNVPIVMTLHVPAKDIMMRRDYARQFLSLSSPLVHCVPISHFQKRQYNDLVRTESVIYHGIEAREYPVKSRPDHGSYLFTIGRLTPDKGQDKAVDIAKATGCKLIIAGCVQNKAADRQFFECLKNSIDLVAHVGREAVDRNYYQRVMRPLLDCDKQTIYLGELNSAHKREWFRHARATLFPIQWGEPFGLVLLESMACGTPPIALNKGAVPELIADGKTGLIADSVEGMIAAVDHIDKIDPDDCRRHVVDHFSTRTMALKYAELYQQILDGHRLSDGYARLAAGCSSRPLHHADGGIAT